MTSHALRSALWPIVALGIWLIGPSSSASTQLRPEPGALELVSGDLLDRLRSDPFVYFRFINRPWTARVCEAFGDESRNLPTVRLHGDAHVEQFAVTKDAWGLDDFDDSARGGWPVCRGPRRVSPLARVIVGADILTRPSNLRWRSHHSRVQHRYR